jgi:hypothetical protein
MSIAGYLTSRYNAELRMPKPAESPLNQAAGGPSIRFEGPVLNGEKSVEEAHRNDAVFAATHRSELHKILEDL